MSINPSEFTFDVPEEVDVFPSALASSTAEPKRQREAAPPRRARRRVGERGVHPQGRDLRFLVLLARCRYLTAPQVMRALWPREAMPPRQTVHNFLGRLQRAGLVEKRTPLDTRWPVYQLTRAGYEVACAVDENVVTQYLAHPSAATVEHTCHVNDAVIAWETGRGWLPDGFQVGRVITEREITAVDKQPPRRPEQYQRRQQPQVIVVPGGGVQDADEPSYGYLTLDRRRGFPDALLLPAGATEVQGAIAVEYQRTLKEVSEFARVLLGYRRTAERTGKYAAVLYLSPDPSTLNNVRAAAAEVGAEHLLLTRLAPPPLWKTWPERTTPLQPKRPREESEWDRWQRLIPKAHRHLVPEYIRAGWAPEAAAEHLAAAGPAQSS
jgi:hypothetical protein